MPKTYALLVGIDDYPIETKVAKLQGCVTDVENLHAWLKASVAADDLEVQILTDAQATRAAIIDGFRKHLGKARKGDVAVFHYSGHGARSVSAPEFREYFPIGLDEGRVCFDSRLPGGYDLADKEMAVLINELAAHEPQIAIILDSCHSGSGTRSAAKMFGAATRATSPVTTARPLESYIDGYYSKRKAQGQSLAIPSAPHILLAACDRTQLAQETQAPDNHSGYFTTTLCEVLGRTHGDLSYADLFVRCRATILDHVEDQDPQFEAIGDFDPNAGFLGREVRAVGTRYSVQHTGDGWELKCGAVHGLPNDPGKRVTLALYPEDSQGTRAGNAVAVQIGAQTSNLELDFAGDESMRYYAEITSMPVAPMALAFDGDDALRAALEMAFSAEKVSPLVLTGASAATDYALHATEGSLQLVQRATENIVNDVAYDAARPDATAAAMLPALRHIAAWERSLALANPATAMDTSLVELAFSCPELGDASIVVDDGQPIVVELPGKETHGKITVTNRSSQLLYMTLVYHSAEFGVQVWKTARLGKGDEVPLFEDSLWLGGDQNLSFENFKLIVTTEQIDDYLFRIDTLEVTLDKLRRAGEPTRGAGPRPVAAYSNEWFTRDCRIRLVHRMAATGTTDVAVANGSIVIKGHPSVTASIALSAATPPTRSLGAAPDFYRAFERQGLKMVNFSNTRGTAGENVLELTGIDGSALRDNPLHIELNVSLKENEAILPLVFDGEHVLFAGDAYKDDAGKTQISISELAPAAISTRSLTGAIKMYFFKTYLKAGNVNLLRRVEYLPEGGFAYRTTEIAEHVAAAKNILLLVHGIIGDTEGMVAGVKECGVADKFDLVLTYDYESLNTLIADTARSLQAQLAQVGIDANDGKSLTMLVHSMGGLVSRWFIEREGGKHAVDHLVMCGTPNNGSPFGKIDGARKIAKVLTGLAMNYIPTVVPVASVLMLALNRSAKVTPALEQMNPDSDFIKTLNTSADPGIRYTILAGNVDDYQEPSDAFFAKMIAKVGQNDVFEMLFAQKPNDIAVGVESILGVGAGRATVPVRSNIACHHLNYFVSANGQKALGNVVW
ncbi:hypothetical protein EUV02_02315 [Polymorphobacter arshaanensis]|uniref:Caspase family protein n=1 Tax=Glacieibacterium arshaanense TaxID=2511025 RepID=A0A4Y9EQI3_9SPHN|nr:caspase family protein [Polymorphobacter arshaanensis]TFU05881.1 hypothetical protein EUV02_02315 [Polymorphobacter arshaanensis]